MALTVTIKFLRWSLEEKVETIQRGRLISDIHIAQSGVSYNRKYVRTFSSDWYDKKNWLCGCELRNTLFCLSCLLMGGYSVWTENGFNVIIRLKEKTSKHEL